MSDARRPGDLSDALGKGLVLFYTFPLIAALIGGIGMAIGLVWAIPVYLYLGVGPEQFMSKHTGLFCLFWGVGIVTLMKGVFGRIIPPGWGQSIGIALLFFLGSALLVLLIVAGLAVWASLVNR